jgi:hypothetical protein
MARNVQIQTMPGLFGFLLSVHTCMQMFYSHSSSQTTSTNSRAPYNLSSSTPVSVAHIHLSM